MTPLKRPSTERQENTALSTLCKAPEWVSHHTTWQAAYQAYRLGTGDPWKIAPAVFATNPAEIEKIAKAQRAFYKSRASGGPFQRIRRTRGLLCCPMCGSQHPGTLDHFLPQESFPEFSILNCNLIPACPHCNSGVKKERYRGTASPERFIHPYFDKLAKDPIWHVAIQPPFEAARFRPEVASSVPPSERPMVQFHLDHILGEVFQDYVSTQWSQLPVLIYGWAVPNEPIIQQTVATQLVDTLRDTAVTSGINGWRTAFLRGVVTNLNAIAFLAGRATQVAVMGCVR